MRIPIQIPAAVATLLFASTGLAAVSQWEPFDLALEAKTPHPWWQFPVTAVFEHAASGKKISIAGSWDGPKRYLVRFAPTLPGEWSYSTRSDDPELRGRTGTIDARKPTGAAIERNPNLRGHLRISADGRHFEYSDSTPFFFLGDTNWAFNTARCGLGQRRDGPFFEYLADRVSKGFTAILVALMRGFGDTDTEPAGQRNEGGHPFHEADVERLNAAYFQSLDERMRAVWERGLVTAGHPTWFGKLNCFFDRETAERITAYLAVRYGAFNHIWSVSGEFQYALRDCGWSGADIDSLGRALQSHNPYGLPVSIHPSGRTNWPAPYGVQSSRAFHDADWLDHHWLQTGQQAELMFNTPARLAENYALEPARPALLSEGFYERSNDPEHAYHARWQVWAALLNGAAGYGYGAFGVWQFYDPDDAAGETGKAAEGTVAWRRALALGGASQLRHAKDALLATPWRGLIPHREWLTVDGKPAPMPTANDITPPHLAALAGQAYLAYIPRGNAAKTIRLGGLAGGAYRGHWVDPRSGAQVRIATPPSRLSEWTLPARPAPANEDWALVLDGRTP